MNNRVSKLIREKMGESYDKRYYNLAKKKYKSLSKTAKAEFLEMLEDLYKNKKEN